MEKYKKSKGAGGQKGIDYQVNILALFALEGLMYANADWKLSTENTDYDKFDDVVYQSSDGDLLMQCKHKENLQLIAKKEVLSVNPKNDDFSSAKYFLSYCKLKDKFTNAFFFVCTNSNIENTECFTEIDNNEITSFPKIGKCYKLNVSSDTLMESIEKYIGNIPKSKDAKQHTKPEADNVPEFLKVFHYISIDDKLLDKHSTSLIEKLSKKFKIEFSMEHFIQEMHRWFMDTNGYYLKKSYAKAFLFEYINKKSLEKLKTYKIEFAPLKLPDEPIVHSTAGEDILLKMSRLYQELLNEYKPENILIMEQTNDYTSDLKFKQFIDVFELPRYTFSIIGANEMSDNEFNEITNDVLTLVKRSKFKKVFILSKQCFHTENVHEFNFTVSFNDLKPSCKVNILQTKCKFQGNKMNIFSMLESTNEVIDENMLLKFTSNHKIDTESLKKAIYSILDTANEIIDEEMLIKFPTNHKIDIDFKKAIDSMLDSANEMINEEMLMKFATNHKSDIEFLEKATYLVLDRAKEIIDEEMLFKYKDQIELKFIKTAIYSMLESEIIDEEMVMKFANKHKIEINIIKMTIQSMLDNANEIIDDEMLKTFATSHKIQIESLKKNIYSMFDSANKIIDEAISRKFAIKHEIEIELIKMAIYSMVDSANKIIDEDMLMNFATIHKTDIKSLKNKIFAMLDSANEIIDKEMIVKFATNQEIEIESIMSDSSDLTTLYIERYFCGQDQKIISEKRLGLDIVEGKIKFVLISAIAGMGKSTMLTRLESIVKQHSNCFVVRINLNNHTKMLSKFNESKENQMQLEDFLKITTVQKKLFHLRRKVILMVDAVDEISPKYTDIVLKFLKDSIELENIRTVVVTTRVHLQKQLENIFHVNALNLKPLSEINQINFLCNCWKSSLKFPSEYDKKCEEYANILLKFLENSIGYGEQKSLLGSPLLTMMIADVFQSGRNNNWTCCEQYIASEEAAVLTKKINLEILYSTFLKKKRAIFIEDKCNAHGNIVTTELCDERFERSLKIHQKLALCTLLDQKSCELFSVYRNTRIRKEDFINIIIMGILQQSEEKTIFVHKTFAEYFVALSIKNELIHGTASVELILYILEATFVIHSFATIRSFIECLLEDTKMEDDILKTLRDIVGHIQYFANRKIEFFTLAREGCFEILKLIFGENPSKWILEVRDLDDRTILHYAVQNMPVTKFLVQLGVDKNAQDSGGKSAVHEAALNSAVSVVQFLVEQGADIAVNDNEGNSLLHYAAEINSIDLVQISLNEIDLNAQNKYGETALHFAVHSNSLEVIEFLVDKKCDINKRDVKGATALHCAAWSNSTNPAIVTYLIEKGADINYTFTCIDNYTRIMENMDDISFDDLDEDTFEEINEEPNKVTSLCRDGNGYLMGNTFVNEEVNEVTLLHQVAGLGSIKTVKYLIEEKGATDSPDSAGRRTLHYAIFLSNPLELITFLSQNGYDINARDNNGESALHFAAFYGRSDIAKYLILQNAVPDIRNEKGENALHIALCSPFQVDIKLVQVLIDGGCDINARDNYGRTPLHRFAARRKTLKLKRKNVFSYRFSPLYKKVFSVCYDKLDMLKFLISRGFDVSSIDKNGMTLLHVVAEFGCDDIVEYLVEKNVDMNTRNSTGRTALHIAALNASGTVATIMIRLGVDQSIKDNFGETALDIAGKIGWELFPEDISGARLEELSISW